MAKWSKLSAKVASCYDCYEKKQLLKECYPLKQRSTRKQQSYTPNIVSRNQGRTRENLEELCEKCIELGRPWEMKFLQEVKELEHFKVFD
jgi:hypothetical protein